MVGAKPHGEFALTPFPQSDSLSGTELLSLNVGGQTEILEPRETADSHMSSVSEAGSEPRSRGLTAFPVYSEQRLKS